MSVVSYYDEYSKHKVVFAFHYLLSPMAAPRVLCRYGTLSHITLSLRSPFFDSSAHICMSFSCPDVDRINQRENLTNLNGHEFLNPHVCMYIYKCTSVKVQVNRFTAGIQQICLHIHTCKEGNIKSKGKVFTRTDVKDS